MSETLHRKGVTVSSRRDFNIIGSMRRFQSLLPIIYAMPKLFLTLLALFSVTLAADTSQRVEIEVDGALYEYSMTETPSVDSPLVRLEKDELHGSLDLEAFVKDLSNVGSFIRIAYNGIRAAGPEFQYQQNQVQKLGFDISNLSDKSAIAFDEFKSTTRTILDEVKAAYELLLNNQEHLALVSFSRLADLAEKMAVTTKKLKNEFNIQWEKVKEMLFQTMTSRPRDGYRIWEIKAQQEQARMNLEMQEKLAKEHERLEAEFKAERLKAEEKEDQAMSSYSGILHSLGIMITSSFKLEIVFGNGSDTINKANIYRQRSIAKLENEKEQRELKHAAYHAMVEFAHDVKMAEGKEEMAGILVEALGKASWSMKQILSLLQQASIFWDNLEEHCRATSGEKIEAVVAVIAEEERRVYWSSMVFKQRMFRYMSKWVALHSVWSTHLEQIRHTQHDLHEYMREDPTYEESRRNLKELVENFEKDLDSAHERISQQNFRSFKIIEQLKNKIFGEGKEEL